MIEACSSDITKGIELMIDAVEALKNYGTVWWFCCK
jgi:hypothetical protein